MIPSVLADSKLGIGWIIQLIEDWGPYKPGHEFKVISVIRPTIDTCSLICSGCIMCEGWTIHSCMITEHCKMGDIHYRNFKIVSRTGIGTFKEGRDMINIVGMI